MIDEKVIFSRIEMLNSIEPDAESLELVMEKVRQSLQEIEASREGLKTNLIRIITKNKITKFAAAAIFVLFVILPLAYGTYKLVTYFIIEESKHSFYYEDRFYTVVQETSVFAEDEDKKDLDIKEIREALRIIKRGEAEQIEPGLYRAILANGKKMKIYLPELPKTREELKTEFDEIDRFKQAGEYERIYKPEHNFVDEEGILHKFYEDHFILSNGEVRVIYGSEKVEESQEGIEPMPPQLLTE